MIDLPSTFVPNFHDETLVRKMKYTKFGKTNLDVSIISIGTGGFCLQYGNYTIEDCKKTLHNAIKAGVNYIDTAPWYGHGVSEEVLGKCLKGIPRQAYYVATKVGRYEADPKLMFNFSATKTRNSIETSLKKLGVDYIDVLQVHDIEFAPSLDIILKETLPVLQEAVNAGKVKFIGVTGYFVSILDDCIKRSTIPFDMVLSYTRLSLLDNTLKEFLPSFQANNLGIVNAAGNCMGLLTNSGPQSWHPASQLITDICTEAREYCILKKVEFAKLALYYCLQQPGPHTQLIGMNTNDLLESNLDVLHNGLSKLENEVLTYIQINILSKLKCGHWEKEILEIKRSLPQYNENT